VPAAQPRSLAKCLLKAFKHSSMSPVPAAGILPTGWTLGDCSMLGSPFYGRMAISQASDDYAEFMPGLVAADFSLYSA
jgi:hypothetical protein